MTRRETSMLGDCKIRACKCWIISSVCIWTRNIQLMKVKDKSHLQFLYSMSLQLSQMWLAYAASLFTNML